MTDRELRLECVKLAVDTAEDSPIMKAAKLARARAEAATRLA